MSSVEVRCAPGAFRFSNALVAFPPAGGSSLTYGRWQKSFLNIAAVCPVEFPGRGSRCQEPFARSNEELVESISLAVAQMPFQKVLLFGQSFGARVAYEVSAALHSMGSPICVGLLVAALRPPIEVPPSSLAFHQLPSDQFWEFLANLGGVAPYVLRDRVLREAIEPVVRNDLRLLSEQPRESVIDVPIHAFGGSEDPLIGPDGLQRWGELTTATFDAHTFPGGHFLFDNHAGVPFQTLQRVVDLLFTKDLRIKATEESSLKLQRHRRTPSYPELLPKHT